MVGIRDRSSLMSSVGLESWENDSETLIFLKEGRNREKKSFHLWWELNPGPWDQKTSVLLIELPEQIWKKIWITAIRTTMRKIKARRPKILYRS